ncbi:MAG: hypothetical protein FJ034_04220 [Chloroflexi bacterium]|nr:hypothetical protein [Chloroflexota bacterium]
MKQPARQASFQANVLTFALVTVLAGAGAVGLIVLMDPRSQTYWGVQFDALGTTVRAFIDALPIPR